MKLKISMIHIQIVGLLICLNNYPVQSIEWPLGTYGLPEPITGCPDRWQNGFVYHNTEDENSLNSNSMASNYHLSGLFNKRGIEQSFCIKNFSGHVESSFLKWTPGKYCIYKKNECPSGMTDGYIHWDEEKSQIDLPTHHEGSLPDGEYTPENTKIYFCCSTDGNIEDELLLPNDRPFYLFPYESDRCQKVAGMKDYLEWVFYDDNDEGNRDNISGTIPYGPNPDVDFNIKLYFCYYEPIEAVIHKPSQEINKKVDKDKDIKLNNADFFFKRNLVIGSVSLIIVICGVGFSIFYSSKKDKVLRLMAYIGKKFGSSSKPSENTKNSI